MVTYRLSEEAKNDLSRIWLYGFEEWGEAQADHYYWNLMEHFQFIAISPLTYPSVDYIREGYRRSKCGVHDIYYQINDDAVEIMAIIGKQDIGEWL